MFYGIMFLVSITIIIVAGYMLYKLRPVFVDEPRMNGFYPMSVVTLAWISVATIELLSAPQYFPIIAITKTAFVTVVAYMTFWFILNFIESRLIHSKIVKTCFIVIPVIDTLALVTTPFHNLYFTELEPIAYPYNAAPVGILFYIHVALISLGVLFFYTKFVRYIFRNFRKYPLLFITGVAVLIPFLLNLAFVFGLFGLNYDYSPIGYFLTIVLFAYYSYTTKVRSYNPHYFSDTLSSITKSDVLYYGVLEDAIKMIAEKGCQALNVQCIAIWKFTDDMNLLEKFIVYESGDVKTMIKDEIDMVKNEDYRETILSQRVFAVDDVKAMQNSLAASIGNEEPTLCAYLDAPIRAEGQPFGVLSIEQHRCKTYPERRKWTINEQSFTSSLADFVSFAIESEKRRKLETVVSESFKRTMLMIDSSPLCTQIWDRNLNTIDCNLAAVYLYGFKDKKEYIDNFIELCSPKYQIDGQRSDEKAVKLVNKAFKDGICTFEWLHKMPYNDSLIPALITLVRVEYNNEDVVIGYTRDLRKEAEMIKDIEFRDRLLGAVNHAASVLLMTDEEADISETLLKSMEIIGSSIDVDRIQLWRNEEIDGELHFVHYFQWCSQLGKKKTELPLGVKISYDHIPEWKELLINGDSINGPLTEVPQNIKEFTNEYGVVSTAITPLFLGDYFWGYFNLDDCVNERYFSDDEITILKSVGLMMINAVARHELIEKRTQELTFQTTILSTLFDAIPDLIFVKDLDLNYVNCNKGLLEFFDRMKDDIIGKNDAYVHGIKEKDAKDFIKWDNKIIDECKTYAIEETLTKSDGTTLLFETIKAPLIINGNVEGIAGIARDITKRKELEQDIIKAKDDAEVANKAKSSFLAKMSHELRTPMNAILGITEILVNAENLPDSIRDGLDRIYSSCMLLLGIINDILDLSKIEAGILDITPVIYSSVSMINDSIQVNIMRIESKQLDFFVKINEDFPLSLEGDELRIKQILNNLLSNAFKYTDKGSVTLNIDYEPGVKDDEVIVVVCIEDTGIGMSEEQLERLFDDYSRFSNDAKTEGVGLGLAISKQLIGLMGGDIIVKSEPGAGSSFTVRFLQRKIGNDVVGEEISKNMRNHTYGVHVQRERRRIIRDIMPYGNVLIVDDVETNRFVAAGLLMRYKLNIDTADSGYDAIDKINSGNVYDIIFMDHMMPGMDGVEATKHIRDMGYNEPIVALTANVVAGQSDMFMKNGFNGFIAKPVDVRLLTNVLNKYIRDKQKPEVLAAARLQMESEEKARKIDDSLSIKSSSPTFNHMLNTGIDGLDMVKGFNRYHKNEKVFLQILRTYVNDVRYLLNGLSYADESNLHDYKIKVHGIKGMSTSIYADQIGEYARDLENAAESNDLEFIKKSNQTFVDASLSLVDEIDKMLKRIEKEASLIEPKNEKDRPDPEILSRLLLASTVYDKSGVDDAMTEIDKYQYKSDDGLAVWLREKVDMMQYMEISERLSKLL
ncbi:MAG: ATP-binding protein [Oscillospiraceae bacterium]|nr:ATP-binding protein [Oscillospiraceae bacterium]